MVELELAQRGGQTLSGGVGGTAEVGWAAARRREKRRPERGGDREGTTVDRVDVTTK